MDSFDRELSIYAIDVDRAFGRWVPLACDSFLLNPRQLRGSDFLMRWSQGEWSEHRLREAINNTKAFYAVPYGPSGVAPANPREYELYFERLEKAGLGNVKRPDLLIFPAAQTAMVDEAVTAVGGFEELPFMSESDERLRRVVRQSVVAIECENSLWKAAAMPDYGKPLKPQRRLGGRLGLAKSAVVPTIN